MSKEQQDLFLEIIVEAYQKGTTSRDISVESLFNEIKEKLVQVINKDMSVQKEV